MSLSGFDMHNDDKLRLHDVPLRALYSFRHLHPCSLVIIRCNLGITARQKMGCSNCGGKVLSIVRRLGATFPRADVLLIDINSHRCGGRGKSLHAVPKIGGLVHCRRSVTTSDRVTF